MIDPVAALVEHLAEHLAETEGISYVLRAWPERPEDLDLTQGPVLSVEPLDATYTWRTPSAVAETVDDDGDMTVTYELADVRLVAQLDLWAAHRAARDAVVPAVDAAFHPQLPALGLRLTLPTYFDQVAAIAPTGAPSVDSADSASSGEWRRRWTLVCQFSLVARARTPRQAQIILRQTTTLSGAPLTEPDVII